MINPDQWTRSPHRQPCPGRCACGRRSPSWAGPARWRRCARCCRAPSTRAAGSRWSAASRDPARAGSSASSHTRLLPTARLGMLQAVGIAVHLQNVDVVGEPVEERAGQPLGAEHACPFLKGQVGGDDGRAALMALAEDLEQQLCPGLGQRHVAKLVSRTAIRPLRQFGRPRQCDRRQRLRLRHLGRTGRGRC